MAPLTIPPDIEAPLLDAARDLGTTPEILAIDCLRQQFVSQEESPAPEDAANLAEYLQGFIGVIQSSERTPGGAQMSQQTGKRFTELLLKQRELRE